jgi:hypothetical protein
VSSFLARCLRGGFDLEEHLMDVDTAETLAGVVRLLRQAAVLAWAAADRAEGGSAGQLFALGVDVAADQARQLVPDGAEIEGPVPVGDEPAGLLGSAELLLRRLGPLAASPGISVTFKMVWRLVRGDANPWLSDLPRWRSSRPGA